MRIDEYDVIYEPVIKAGDSAATVKEVQEVFNEFLDAIWDFEGTTAARTVAATLVQEIITELQNLREDS